VQDIVKKSLITEEETWFLQKVKRERKKKGHSKKEPYHRRGNLVSTEGEEREKRQKKNRRV
jgi:hypothetical protein